MKKIKRIILYTNERGVNILFLFLSFIFSFHVHSQEILTERIKFTIPEKEYAPGDTILFSGQVFSTDSIEKPYSRYTYVEIIGKNDSVITRKKYRCGEDGSFTGKLPIDKDWEPGIFYLRSYTRLMQNFSPGTFYIRPLAIDCQLQKAEEVPTRVDCHFYPEGGNLADASTQNVAIYLNDANRFPVQASFCLLSGNDTIKTGTTSNAGLSVLTFNPSALKNYTLVTTCGGKTYSFELPKTYAKKPTLQVVKSRTFINCQVMGKQDNKSLRLYCFHDQFGLKELTLNQQNQSSINWAGLPMKGVLAFFLIDDKQEICAQRSILLEETKPEEFPLACHDVLSPIPWRKGMTQKDIQLWMMTANFQRFNVKDALKEGFSYTYPAESVLTIKGQLTDRFKKPYGRATVYAYNRNTFSSSSTEVDENGYYTLIVDDFKDGDEWFVSAETGKKYKESGLFHYNLQDESFPAVLIPHRERRDFGYADSETEIAQSNGQFDFNGINDLPEISVKAKYKETVIDPKDATRKFYGNNYVPVYKMRDRFFDFKSIIDKMPTLFLEKRMNSRGIGKAILYNSRNANVTIMLDGSYITPDEAWILNPFDLDEVVYLTPTEALAYTWNAFGGLLMITTARSHADDDKKKSKGIWYSPLGLSD